METEIIDAILAKDINVLEPRLTRHGYNAKALAELLDTKPAEIRLLRGVAIFAKAFMGIPAQQAAKITRPLMPSAAPAVLLHSLHTQRGVCNIVAQ